MTFTYNINAGTRVVTDPRPGVPPTTYTVDSYGATTEIDAPTISGQGTNITRMTWADPATPAPNAFSNVDGTLTPNETRGIDVEMVSQTDPEGQKTSYVYDVNGNVVRTTISFAGMNSAIYMPVTEADGTTPLPGNAIVTSATYDPIFNVMTSQIDANGHTTYDIYDSTYEQTHPTPAVASRPVTFTGNDTGNLMAAVDADGNTTTYTYAPPGAYNGTYGPGDLETVTDPRGLVTTYLSYDPYGNATAIADPNDNVTTQTFDVRSRMTSQTAAGTQTLSQTTTVSPTVGGREQSTTLYVYDDLDRVVRQVEIDDLDPADNAFSLPQDAGLPSMTLPGREVVQATSTPLPVSDWAEETINQYLPGGQLAETINGLGMVTQYAYDNADRLLVQTQTNFVVAPNAPVPPGTGYLADAPVPVATTYVTTYAYDQDNNLVEETDPRHITTMYSYDNLNDMIGTEVGTVPGSTGEMIETTSATYDLAGNKLTSTDIHGNVTTYQYDGLYRLVATILPVAGPSGQAEIKTGYDPVGNVVLQTDANGNPTTSAYDAANRLTSQTDPLGNKVENQYDADGNLTLETHESPTNETPKGPNGPPYEVTSYVFKTYDNLNRPLEMDQYVALGDPTALGVPPIPTGPAGTTANGTTTGQAVYVTTYAYDDKDNTVLTTDPRGNQSGATVSGQTLDQNDGLDRLKSETVDVGGWNLKTTYTYDADGNQASVTDPSGSTTTSIYDGLDRLIETIDPQLSSGVQYTELSYYDGDNNPIATINQRGIDFSTDYDNLNRVVAQNVKETISNDGQWLTLTAATYHDAGTGAGAIKTYSVTVTDAKGNPTTTTYDALDRPLVVTEPAVLVTDASGATSVVNPTIVSTYDGVNLLSQTDANRNKTVYVYDADNRVIETEEYDNTGALQATTVDVYNDARNQVVQEGPRSDGGALIDTITQNDSLGRLVSQAVSNASLSGEYGTSVVTLVQNQYDGDGNLVATFDADGNETTYTYDGANRKTSMTVAAGTSVAATTRYAYDAVGDLIAVQGPRVHAAPSQSFPQDPRNPVPFSSFDEYFTYDAMHRQVTTTDGAGDTTSQVLDGDGNVVSMTTPNVNTTTYTYDELDTLLSVNETQDGGGITYYVYDANRNKIAQQDANGDLVTYKYDALNRLTDTYQFLTPGTLNGTPARSSLSVSSLYPTNPPATQAIHWQYGYDANGNQTLVIDPKGQQTHMAYDFRNRLASTTYTNAADPSLAYQPLSIAYQYDLDDNLTQSIETKTGPSGADITEQYVYDYDALDNLTETTRHDDLGASDDIVTYIGDTYDKQGNLTSETVPAANQPLPSSPWPPSSLPAPSAITTTYDYDAQNRLTAVNTGSGTTSYAYNPDGLVASVQYPSGIVASSTYDAAGRLTLLVNQTASVFISSFQYTYDSDGNRLSQTEVHFWPTASGMMTEEVSEQTTYMYDKLDRLSSVQYTSSQNGINAGLSYTYDADGNRLSETGTDPSKPSQPVNLAYAYNRLNELMSVTNNLDASQSTAYTYDANGNRTTETVGASSVTPYFYNILDELVKTTDTTNGGVVTFDYDASGMRDAMIDSTGETRYLYDGSGNLVLQYSGGTQATLLKYNYGLALVSSVDASASESFYLNDVLGSVSELTNLAGQVTEGMQYDAWGNVIQSYSGGITPVGFTGQLADTDTGLDYFLHSVLRHRDRYVHQSGHIPR